MCKGSRGFPEIRSSLSGDERRFHASEGCVARRSSTPGLHTPIFLKRAREVANLLKLELKPLGGLVWCLSRGGKKAWAKNHLWRGERRSWRKIGWPPLRCWVMLDEGGKEAGGTREERICGRRQWCGTGDALGDKEVGVRGRRWEGNRAGAMASWACGEDTGRLSWKGCAFGTLAGGLGDSKGKGSGGEGGRGNFWVEEGVRWVRECA